MPIAASNNIQESFSLNADRYGVAISWDESRPPIDLDLQAVVVDESGRITDAVYYNNMKALRCITHSGDEQTGVGDGHDETIWVGLSRLPPQVKMIIFVVAAREGGHLRDIQNGKLHILESNKSNEVACYGLERSEEEVDAMACMVKGVDGWSLRLLDLPAEDGRHFMDILEPTIGNIIRSEIPSAPRRMKVAFAMEKNAVVDLPRVEAMPSLTAGLGWDAEGQGVDLDVSAVCFDSRGHCVDAVFFGNLQSAGLTHSGDNLTGAGAGDDEQIHCRMDQIPPQICQVIFVINVYSKGVSFERVRNPYCRILDDNGQELARYQLSEGKRENGLMVARLFRDGGRWGFQALGKFCSGNTYKDSIPHMANIVRVTPQALQAMGTTTNFGGGLATPPGRGSAAMAVPPDQRPPGECCAVQ